MDYLNFISGLEVCIFQPGYRSLPSACGVESAIDGPLKQSSDGADSGIQITSSSAALGCNL